MAHGQKVPTYARARTASKHHHPQKSWATHMEIERLEEKERHRVRERKREREE